MRATKLFSRSPRSLGRHPPVIHFPTPSHFSDISHIPSALLEFGYSKQDLVQILWAFLA